MRVACCPSGVETSHQTRGRSRGPSPDPVPLLSILQQALAQPKPADTTQISAAAFSALAPLISTWHSPPASMPSSHLRLPYPPFPAPALPAPLTLLERKQQAPALAPATLDHCRQAQTAATRVEWQHRLSCAHCRSRTSAAARTTLAPSKRRRPLLGDAQDGGALPGRAGERVGFVFWGRM